MKCLTTFLVYGRYLISGHYHQLFHWENNELNPFPKMDKRRLEQTVLPRICSFFLYQHILLSHGAAKFLATELHFPTSLAAQGWPYFTVSANGFYMRVCGVYFICCL